MNLVTRCLVALAVLALPAACWADYQTQTNLPHDINGAKVSKYRGVKGVQYSQADGKVIVTVPNDEWAVDHASKDIPEWFSHLRGARVWVKADLEQPGWSPARAVSDFVNMKKGEVGGTWTEPVAGSMAGVPVMMATGTDLHGNYYFEAYGVTRLGVQYLVVMRTPYENRWNRELNSDLAWFIAHVHPSTAVVLDRLKQDREK